MDFSIYHRRDTCTGGIWDCLSDEKRRFAPRETGVYFYFTALLVADWRTCHSDFLCERKMEEKGAGVYVAQRRCVKGVV